MELLHLSTRESALKFPQALKCPMHFEFLVHFCEKQSTENSNLSGVSALLRREIALRNCVIDDN